MAWMIGRAGLLGFAAACVMLVISAAISYQNLQEISRDGLWVIHTYEVINGLNRIVSAVVDAETGQRGFVITGNDNYLLPYRTGAEDAERSLQRVRLLTADNPAQQRRIATLRTAVEGRLLTLARGNKIRKENGFEPARDYVAEGLGEKQMDSIRAEVDEMLKDEQLLLEGRSETSAATYRTAIVTLLLSTSVGLVMVVTAFAFAAREITNRRQAAVLLERRVQERTEDLKQTNAALEISNRELEQFASVASHDLQEPLRKIEAFGDRLKTRYCETLDESGRDFLDRILSSASRMRSLINDLLSFSRITTRAQPHQLINLSVVAEEVVSDLEGRLHQVEGKVMIGTLPAIEADALQIRQLLQNLIGNALKFHRTGVPPVVHLAAEIVTPPAGRPQCQLTVTDNGIGFEEVYLDRIFNVFQRLHGRNEYEGTGMGLAISRKIVERHGGIITARSVLGAGSTFIIHLPTTQPNDTEKEDI
jgi:signal transduction histidine kinase